MLKQLKMHVESTAKDIRLTMLSMIQTTLGRRMYEKMSQQQKMSLKTIEKRARAGQERNHGNGSAANMKRSQEEWKVSFTEARETYPSRPSESARGD